ncbi:MULTISPECIES: Crp/Fnr family transcriptional regulator [unclassified Crossiella]|uniref:Crp/Fnr family transcriptional regulator n=1 Tax=unclassified Crossiella TaxID=2620835 RepID=UPI001FFE85DC|nr:MULTISPECIES: Crp/Fnr family transcriptional regulator [unclassified Crossiella]MCK2240639.1 Crp/Fnr family transcriptional regulator [Crossiella sp. S99.2]MCK2252910.1 Crp/Fnr family transcriptional regulator [Crossiella sp. S99.1]
MNERTLEPLLTRCPIFAEAPSGPAVELAMSLQRTVYPAGKLVYAERDPADRIFLVLAGIVTLIRNSCDRERRILMSVRGPAEIFGEVEVYERCARETAAVAHNQLTVLSMEEKAFRRWIRRHRAVEDSLLRDMARQLRRANRQLTHLRCIDVDSQLAHVIVEACSKFGTIAHHLWSVELSLALLECNQQIGASKETVNKALADFLDRGWLRIEGQTLFVVAPEQLTRRAEDS